MGLAPWSTSIELSWKPNLRYFQQRFDLLSDVESLTGVREYRFEGDTVLARLDSPGWAEVVMQRDGLSLHRRLPEGGWQELLLAGRLVMGALGPATPIRVAVYSQYLVEVPDMSYDEARRRTGDRIAGSWAADVGLTDWAFLVDGVDDGAGYQTEFGIVQREEIPPRLARFAGRITGPEADMRRLLREVHPEDVPEVAFFSDFKWRRARDQQAEGLMDYCTRLIDKSTVIVSKLFKAATTGSDESAKPEGELMGGG